MTTQQQRRCNSKGRSRSLRDDKQEGQTKEANNNNGNNNAKSNGKDKGSG
jgi:hypothetical protein